MCHVRNVNYTGIIRTIRWNSIRELISVTPILLLLETVSLVVEQQRRLGSFTSMDTLI